MLNKILIFNTESTVETNGVEKNEKEIFYDELKKNNIKHSKSFYEMYMYDINHKFTTSTIDTILFQQILPYVTPIIEYIPSSIIKPKDEKPKFVYKTESDVVCFYNNKKINVSKYSYISIIGVAVNKNLDRTDRFIYNYLVNYLDTDTTKQDLVKSGNVSLNNLLIDKYYVFNEQIEFTYKNNEKNIYFNGDNKMILDYIITSIKAAREHYEHNNAILYKTIYMQAVSLHKKNIPYIPEVTIPKCSDITVELGKITKHNFCYVDRDNTLLHVYNSGYYIYYNKLSLTNDKNLYNEIKYIIDVKNAKDSQTIILDKKQLQMFKKNNIAVSRFKTTLAMATKLQLVQIDKIYETSLLTINIPEMEIVYALIQAMNSDDKIGIKENLDKLYKIKELSKLKNLPDDFIKIKETNIICSHIIYKANLLLETYKDSIEKNKKIRNILVSKYFDPLLNGYFCKICGEKLAEKDSEYDLQRSEGYSTNDFDPLYTNIYREVTYIVTNFVEFGNVHMHNIFSIIKNISDILKNEILDIQINLLKVKTLGKENIVSVLSIYIYIYAFAFISQLIYTNEFISFRQNIFGGRSPMIELKHDIKPTKDIDEMLQSKVAKSAKNMRTIQYIINTAISLVKKIKMKDIHESKIISLQSINSIFLKAYRLITQINYTVIIDPSISYWDKNNAVIDYLTYVYKQSKHEFRGDVDFVHILGRSHKTIESDLSKKNIYDTIVKPIKWTDDQYNNDSALALFEYIYKSLYLENVSTSKTLVDFYDKYAYLLTLEKEKIKKIKLRQLQSTINILYIPYLYVKKDSKFKTCECTNKSYIYQKVMSNGNFTKDKPITLTLNDIKKWLDEKNYKKMEEFKFLYLLESKCNCNKAIGNNNIVSFYKFYENKCPLGDLHDLEMVKSKMTCTKCSITQDILQSLDLKYYNKYLTIFTAIKRKEYDAIKIPKYIKIKEQKLTFPKWEINTQSIQKISTQLNVTVNTMYNIGLAENKEYSEKIFAKTNMAAELSTDEIIKQNNNLYGYYLFIIRNYYIIKNSDILSDLPVFVKEFLSNENKDNFLKLPMVNIEFQEKYKYYKKNLSPKIFTNFLITSISDLLLVIITSFKTIRLNIGNTFVKLLFDQIVFSEKQLSKFNDRKYLKRKNETINILLENQNTVESNFDNDDVEAFNEEPDIEIDDDADAYTTQNLEQDVDIFSIGDIDIENDDDNNYIDVQDRQN